MGIIWGTAKAITSMMLGDPPRLQFLVADTSGTFFFQQILSHLLRFIVVPERRGKTTQNGLGRQAELLNIIAFL